MFKLLRNFQWLLEQFCWQVQSNISNCYNFEIVWDGLKQLYITQKLAQNPNKIYYILRNFEKKPLKSSTPHEEINFINTSWKFFAQSSKRKDYILRTFQNRSKCPAGQVEVSFENTSSFLNLYLLSLEQASSHPRVLVFRELISNVIFERVQTHRRRKISIGIEIISATEELPEKLPLLAWNSAVDVSQNFVFCLPFPSVTWNQPHFRSLNLLK